MNNTKILLVGTVSNQARNIQHNLEHLESVIAKLGSLRILVIESDSNDATLNILSELSATKSNFRFISLGNLKEIMPDKVTRLRFARNQYVNEIRNSENEENIDVVIVADFDGINNKLNYLALSRALLDISDWDCITANQSKGYYDIFALRHEFWSPRNYLDSITWANTFLPKYKSYELFVSSRMIKINKNARPIKVDSAFGGLAIYKSWVFEKCNYGEMSHRSDECEHVELNRQITSHGGQICIAPYLINSGWNEHNKIRLVYKFLPKLYFRIKKVH